MPSLIDHLSFRAKLHPDTVAIQQLGRKMTYAQLSRFVKKVANKLRQTGIQPGQTVITALPDKYLDWVLTLALFHEATITCSTQGNRALPKSVNYDWIITDRHAAHFPAEKRILIDNAWLADAGRQSDNVDRVDYESMASLVRITLTSGTTGGAKAVAHTLDHVMAWAKHTLLTSNSCGSTLQLMTMSTIGGFNNAVTELITGQVLYCSRNHIESIDLIAENAIECLNGSPIQLSGLMDELIARDRKLASLKMVRHAGGVAAPSLLHKIFSRLTNNTLNLYGSTEAGPVCIFQSHPDFDPAAVGYPFPDVEVEVVDEYDMPVPQGGEGLIRVKTPYMVHDYYQNPEASAKSFRGGWFFPGDRGRLMKDGLLMLAGRDAELINRGGHKIDPVPIDQFLLDYEGILDAAVFGLDSKAGMQKVAAALVIAESFDVQRLEQAVLKKFGRAHSPSLFLRVHKIPRNAMGKVMRAQLSENVASALKKRENASKEG